MVKPVMKQSNIVMTFSAPPSSEDLMAIAEEVLEFFPDELKKYVGDFTLEIEDFPDVDVEDELDLESPYDQLAYYKELSLGVKNRGVSSVGKGDADILVLYRRPILDMWCETEQNLSDILRFAIVQEVGLHCGFTDEEVEEMLEQ